MPFTPIHMGPGILIKAVLQGGFSLMVFGWAQIVMDIQPLWVMLTGEGQLHGFSHTLIGASLLAVFSLVSGKYLTEVGLRILGIAKPDSPIVISWSVAAASAFIGTYSHVWLDAIMHVDVAPLYPFSNQNGWLGVISIDELHVFCLVCGVVGAAIFFAVQWSVKSVKGNRSR
ncbi:MAG: hypothetical protein PVG22_13045 [Chromatiales bacterium]|jgi:hypothetical protein